MRRIVSVFAAGSGTRFGVEGVPKQFRTMGDRPVLIHTLQSLDDMEFVDEIIVSVSKDWVDFTSKIIADANLKKISRVVLGGQTGHETRMLAVNQLENIEDCAVVFHDGVRPIVFQEDFEETFSLLEQWEVVVSLSRVTSTPVLLESERKPPRLLARESVFLGASPQGARIELLSSIARKSLPADKALDLLSAATLVGLKVKFRNLSGPDFKLTHPSDWLILEGLLAERTNTPGG